MQQNSNSPNISALDQIKDLNNLIGEGHKRIGDQKEDKAILIMGETGAGKSTLTCLLAGKDLEAAQNEEGEFSIDTVEQIGGLKIGLEKASETKIPTKIKTESDCVVWDCPGFGDLGRDAIQDIANAFYIQRLFDTTKELKFVLAVPEYHMMGRGADLLRVVTHFVKIFKDIEDIQNSVCLVVTQVSPGKTPVHFRRTLEKILAENTSLEASNKKLLEYLLKSVEVFHKPTTPGPILKLTAKGDSILEAIESSTEYLTPKPGSANVVISINSVELADELFNKSHQALLNLFTEVSGKIKAVCEKVHDKGNEITGVSKLFDDQAQFYDITQAHYKELLNLESILAFDTFCSSALKQKENVQEWLALLGERISNVISVLEQYYQDAKSAEITNLEYQIKENLEYLRFLSKVCENKTVKLEDFIKIVGDCKASIDKATLKGAESIVFNPSERNPEYYQTAIRFLDLHPKSKKCQEVKGQAYYYIADLQKSERKFEEAIKSAKDAIQMNINFREPLDLIDDICIHGNTLINTFTCDHQATRHILDDLNERNEQEFLKTLSEIKALVNAALETEPGDKSSELMVFVENLSAALDVMLSTTSNKKETSITQFGEAITKIAARLCPATSKDLLQKLDIRTKYLNDLKQKRSSLFHISESKPIEIDIWVSYLDTTKTANVLYDKIKDLDLQNGDLDYYEKVIKYTRLELNGINLEQDPVCKNKRAISNYEIGRIKQSQECYTEAFDYYINAIELKRDLEEAYRRLDEIYFISGTIVPTDKKAIAKKLLQFNVAEWSRILRNRLIKFYQDYIRDRKFFTNESHIGYIDYLDNLTDLYNGLPRISSSSQDISLDLVDFFDGLKLISKILVKDAIQEKIKNDIQDSKNTICEQIHEAEGLFATNILEKQLQYIKELYSIQNKNIRAALDNWTNLFDLDQLKDKLEKFVQSINLCYQEEDCGYYKRVIAHVKKYSSDKICVDINIQSHLCLAQRAKSQDEEIQYYLDILRLNDRLLELCLGHDNTFYSKKSIKKQVCDKLGDIYYKAGSIEDAIKYFKMVGNYIKIMKCFDKLINSDEENSSYRERKGDYLDEKGMIDSAIGCYQEALSLTTDPDISVRINQKIASVLTSPATRAKEYIRMANEIATTKIALK